MNDTELARLALAELGDKYSISDIDERTPQAGVCKVFFASTRDSLLRMHPWSFARKSATLSQLSTAPLFGWQYRYQLPADFIALRQFNDLEVSQIEGDYEIEAGRVLVTDEGRADIVYTSRVIDANLFDPLFVEAFALKLAIRICPKLEDSESKMQELSQRFRRMWSEARQVDANETRPRRMPSQWESELVRARR